MGTRIFSTLKYAGLFLAVIGLGLILLSPFIGEPVTPDLLWWIEPVAYVGAGLFIFGAIVGYVSVKFNTNTRSARPDGRTWSQVTQDYFDTFAHDMGRPCEGYLVNNEKPEHCLMKREKSHNVWLQSCLTK